MSCIIRFVKKTAVRNCLVVNLIFVNCRNVQVAFSIDYRIAFLLQAVEKN